MSSSESITERTICWASDDSVGKSMPNVTFGLRGVPRIFIRQFTRMLPDVKLLPICKSDRLTPLTVY